MSEIRVENIVGETGTDAVKFTKGINVTGIATATNVSVGSSVTAATFFGDGSGLTNVIIGGATGVDFNNNVKARFGNGNNLELYHSGTVSFIDDLTGGSDGVSIRGKNVRLQSNANIGAKSAINCIANGAVELFHNASKKFETLSDGVNITGTLKVNGSAFSSSSDKIEEGNSFAEVLDTGTNGIFRFLAENNEVFRITTDGKIGLGQTANSFPTSRFEIRENAVGFTTSLLITNLNPTNQNNLNIVFAGANNVPTASIGGWAHADATSTANEKGDLFFRTKNAGAFKEHMRINHQGKMIYACNHDQSDRFNDNYSGNNGRNVFNSVTHHKRYVGYDNPTWYEYKTTSGGSARPQLVYFTCYWSTGHASGFGYYNFHVIGRNPHNTNNLTIERARRGDYGSWGGQYYGWSSSPDITIYRSTKTGSDAGFFIRSQGHISANSGTWDGNCVQQWKIEAYDNQFAGVDNAIFTFAGHSTPSGVGGSVGWG